MKTILIRILLIFCFLFVSQLVVKGTSPLYPIGGPFVSFDVAPSGSDGDIQVMVFGNIYADGIKVSFYLTRTDNGDRTIYDVIIPVSQGSAIFSIPPSFRGPIISVSIKSVEYINPPTNPHLH